MIVVLITCPNRRVAETLGRTLVEDRLAACANVVPGLTSIYRWQGKLCRDREVLVLLKTRRPRFAALARRVRELHPYSVPEVIALSVAAGSPAYLAWVAESTG
ncbi:MAG TPA: divalent-cation tolerance protein CutA [Nitrospirota bacterium]|nr:divalent-cation tolerance protein CutA [Nitrospirota bacterium]